MIHNTKGRVVSGIRILGTIFMLLAGAGTEAYTATSATFAVGPDSNQGLLLQTIRSAKSTLWINIYEFNHSRIADAIVDRIEAGVSVRFLIEGQPVGGVDRESLDLLERIQTAMAKSKNPAHRLFVMTDGRKLGSSGQFEGEPRAARRFVFDHAKYLIVDGKKAWVSSDNFSKSGHTNPGKYGSRGWDVVITDRLTVQELQRLYNGDTDTSFGDVIEVQSGQPIPVALDPKPQGSEPEPSDKDRTLTPVLSQGGSVQSIEIITSPKSGDALVELIESAHSAVDIQHMSFPKNWKDSSGAEVMNPVLKALIDQARRGVRVRVLLNDPKAFEKPGSSPAPGAPVPSNTACVEFINDLAKTEKLPMAARLIDLKATQINYIHNKGILVDDDLTLVSSINGSKNSVENNRELALRLHSRDANAYFGGVFDFDWTVSRRGQFNRAMNTLLELFELPALSVY